MDRPSCWSLEPDTICVRLSFSRFLGNLKTDSKVQHDVDLGHACTMITLFHSECLQLLRECPTGPSG
ncbi:hypothetical protein M405DRAFT_52422 [Rhizopogon salebrosus TDB-379]|nr:hypothetical protein M405DRAFT_52422 [Rhizopogon salebrosus TDB-379]